MAGVIEGKLIGKGKKVAVVASRFNDFITARLIEGAMDALKRHGVEEKDVTIYRVPGAFEIPPVAKRLAQAKKVDGVICLGAVIRGSTPHFDYVASEVSKGVALVSLEAPCPESSGCSPPTPLSRQSSGPAPRRGTRASMPPWRCWR